MSQPILEIAHLRLHPYPPPSTSPIHTASLSTFSTSGLPASFIAFCARTCTAASTASRIPFRLYRSASSPSDFYLIGAWKAQTKHPTFVHSANAREMATAIGDWVHTLRVAHVAADINALPWSSSSSSSSLEAPKVILLREYLVPSPSFSEGEGYEPIFLPRPHTASGWEVSSQVQASHVEFKEMAAVAAGTARSEDAGPFKVNGEEKERRRFALSIVGAGTDGEERGIGFDGARIVRREVLRYVLG